MKQLIRASRNGLFAVVIAVTSTRCQIPAPASSQMARKVFVAGNASRDFLIFRPATYPARGADRSIVVMLHGCGQSGEDFARGTRMNAEATEGRFLVIYPEQVAAAQPQRCWNWYVPAQSTRGHGEVALLAALIDSVAFAEGVSEQHVSIVGMDAGASMAAALTVAYGERYGGLALHSGIPALAANDLMGVLAAKRVGNADGDALGRAALAAMGSRAHALPVIALHGAADTVVSPRNLAAIVRQWRIVNTRAAGAGALVEEHLIPGVGHGWSGGSADEMLTAPDGPDATSMIVEFLRRVGAITPLR